MKYILITRDVDGYTNVVFWSRDYDEVMEEANKVGATKEVYLLKIGEEGDNFVGLYRRELELQTTWGLTSTNYGNSGVE